MSPEYGATCGFFPVDDATLDYLRLTGRSAERIALVEAYCKENLLWHEPSHRPEYSQVVELDLGEVEPSLAGPRRPQDRVPLSRAKPSFRRRSAPSASRSRTARTTPRSPTRSRRATRRPSRRPAGEPEPEPDAVPVAAPRPPHRGVRVALDGEEFELGDGAVVIAAITSCTNTSNPQVMVGAGLLAKKAVELGLRRRPWVKSSLAPGSRVVTDYYERAGLQAYLDELGFNTVGYGCTTCIGNSGPLPRRDLGRDRRRRPRRVRGALRQPQLRGAHPPRGEGELPRLAAARRRLRARRPDGHRPRDRAARRTACYLRDLWPSSAEIQETIARAVGGDLFARTYADVFTGDETLARAARPGRRPLRVGGALDVRAAADATSRASRASTATSTDVAGARCLVVLGDSVTTDHISPAGSIKRGLAGRALPRRARRRAARLQLVRRAARQPRGDGARHVRERAAAEPARARLGGDAGRCTSRRARRATIFDVAERYLAEGTPLVVIAGKEYGSGSSRDWAAKGPALLGVRAVIAESYERIHRSNLLMMGILPLQFAPGESRRRSGSRAARSSRSSASRTARRAR